MSFDWGGFLVIFLAILAAELASDVIHSGRPVKIESIPAPPPAPRTAADLARQMFPNAVTV